MNQSTMKMVAIRRGSWIPGSMIWVGYSTNVQALGIVLNKIELEIKSIQTQHVITNISTASA